MANSQSNPAIKAKELQFRVLDALYNFSNGNKYFIVPFGKLYEYLQAKNDDAQEPIRAALEYLSYNRLVESRGLGTISIAHQGIKVYEEAILNPASYADYFPLRTTEMASTEAKKNEIRAIRSQRDAFLHGVYKLSGRSSMQTVDTSEVLKTVPDGSKNFEKILTYLVDEGFIKSLAIGGGIVTITFEGIKQVEKGQSF